MFYTGFKGCSDADKNNWMTDEQIGKHIRHYLVKAQNAPVTVQYEELTEDMMKALNEFDPK
ncbi:hypothetical protein CG428_21600 [Pantoea ananatis]|nr:hypothetical protein [Pantoea ananatis]PQK69534.1 hypothetical protein CG428_21600 [Pantoea ananatis]